MSQKEKSWRVVLTKLCTLIGALTVLAIPYLAYDFLTQAKVRVLSSPVA